MKRTRAAAVGLSIATIALLFGCAKLLDIPTFQGDGDGGVASDASLPIDASIPNDGSTSDASGMCAPSYAAMVFAASPLAYFRFAESGQAGAACKDEVDSAITCSYPASHVTFEGNAVHLVNDDRANFITINEPTTTPENGLDFRGDVPFTVELWASLDSPAAGELLFKVMTYDLPMDGYLVGLVSSDAGLGPRSQLWNAVSIGGCDGPTNGCVQIYSEHNTTPTAGAHHYVLVHDGVDHLYVDGIDGFNVQLQGSTNRRPAVNEPLNLAGYTGTIAEFAVYATAMSASDVTAHFHACNGM